MNQHPWTSGEELEDVVKLMHEGEGKMPRYSKKMNDAEMMAVARYTLDLFGDPRSSPR